MFGWSIFCRISISRANSFGSFTFLLDIFLIARQPSSPDPLSRPFRTVPNAPVPKGCVSYSLQFYCWSRSSPQYCRSAILRTNLSWALVLVPFWPKQIYLDIRVLDSHNVPATTRSCELHDQGARWCSIQLRQRVIAGMGSCWLNEWECSHEVATLDKMVLLQGRQCAHFYLSRVRWERSLAGYLLIDHDQKGGYWLRAFVDAEDFGGSHSEGLRYAAFEVLPPFDDAPQFLGG